MTTMVTIFMVMLFIFVIGAVFGRPQTNVSVTNGRRLMLITKAIPERDEKFKICNWKYEELLINPDNIQFVSYVDEIARATVSLTNGQTLPVKETQKELANRFKESMQ